MNNEELNKDQQRELLEIAKATVESFVKKGIIPDFKIADERLMRKEGVFVTLNKNGELRGCIGLIVSPGQPLWENVQEMAIAAATRDTRFEPVSVEELPELEYEISVLSKPREIKNWRDIRLGEQGVIVSQGGNRGVFLPQVAAETGWGLEEFLSQLCSQKAGLPPDCYRDDPDVKLEVFSAQVFKD
jgi:AmmeMemoRadiSam system protein A